MALTVENNPVVPQVQVPSSAARALELIKEGFSVIPVTAPGERNRDGTSVLNAGKKPRGSAWNKQPRITPETVGTAFPANKPTNIGVLLGAVSGNLMDVDMDCDAAVALASKYLPETRSFGPEGLPPTHRIYRLIGDRLPAETDKLKYTTVNGTKIPKRAGVSDTIIETRWSDGHTVFPGSVNAAGQKIIWHDITVPITSVEWTELEANVVRLVEHVRHDYNLPSEPVAPPPKARQHRDPSEPPSSFVLAAEKYNDAHFEPFPPRKTQCPMCGGGNSPSFSRLDDDPKKWACFHANHSAEHGGSPMKGGTGFFGSQLDIDAAEAGLSPAQLLWRWETAAAGAAAVGKPLAALPPDDDDDEPPEPPPAARVLPPAPLSPQAAASVIPSNPIVHAAPPAAPPVLPLNMGVWGPKDAATHYFDDVTQKYRCEDRKNAPFLDAGRPKLGMIQRMTSFYGMPGKTAVRIMEGFRIITAHDLDPALPPGPVQQGNAFVYNSYAKSSIRPVPGQWTNIRKLLMRLVDEDPLAFEYFMDWLAAPLQSIEIAKRALKLRTAVVLFGRPGAGKGTVEEIMRLLYGANYVASVGQEILDGPYQGILANKLLVVADEVRAHDRAEYNRLKSMITSPTININEKFEKMVTLPNFAQYLFTSNEEVPVKIEDGDRRFSVFNTKDPDPTILTAVWKDLGPHGSVGPRTEVAAFFDFLLNRQLTHNLEVPFSNAARASVQVQSMKPAQAFVHDVKQRGLREAAAPWLTKKGQFDPREVTVTAASKDVLAETLLDIYVAWLSHARIRAPGCAPTKTLSDFEKAGLFTGRTRHTIGQLRKWAYTGIQLELPGEEAVSEAEAPPAVKGVAADPALPFH